MPSEITLNVLWIPSDEGERPHSRLMAEPRIHVEGVRLHLEAIAVTYNDMGEMIALNPDYEEDLRALYLMYPAGNAFRTFHHNGYEYVPYALPSA